MVQDWASALGEELGLPEEVVDVDAVLDLAKDVASAVARPAAPLSAFLCGLAAGRAGGGVEQVQAAFATARALAARWPAPEGEDGR